jgi:hypothetical protein
MKVAVNRKSFLASMLILFSLLIVALLSACTTPQALLGDDFSGSAVPGQIDTVLTHSPTGSAHLSWNAADHTLTVKVSLSGLAPNSTHPEHIHAGSCASNPMGPIVYSLQPLVADAHGVGTAVTIISGVMHGIPEHGWSVNVHNGPQLTTALQSRPIACGNVFNYNDDTHSSHQSKQSVRVTLVGTMAPDESVHGHAWISIHDGDLVVKISVSGLAPYTTHMAHIHAGSCKAQGPVVYPLQPVIADAYGNATTTTIIKNVSKQALDAKLYVNIHEAGTMSGMSTQAGFNPIACGNITD